MGQSQRSEEFALQVRRVRSSGHLLDDHSEQDIARVVIAPSRSGREVERIAQRGRALVFFRHLYYLRVPFVNGDPQNSWEADPSRLQSNAAWKEFFARREIRWVVKSGDYPSSLYESLLQLEHDGVLVPCASGEAENFIGNRIDGNRVREPITLYCVQ